MFFLANSLYNPIDTLDFTQGKNKVIIYTNKVDICFLPEGIKTWTLLECLFTSSKDLLICLDGLPLFFIIYI